MKREKEVPAELLAYLEKRNQRSQTAFDKLDIFCTVPVRAVRMNMLLDDDSNDSDDEGFRTAIIPPVDVYTTEKAFLKDGFLKRDSMSYFVAGTKKAFPYGHVYAESGYICLGSIFVPSAVPERSATTPLETLFLHNDRNLSHGNSHLQIDFIQAEAVKHIIEDRRIRLGKLASIVLELPGADIIKNDEIWSLSADVASQRPLPEALHIMSDIYNIIFKPDPKPDGSESEAK